MKYPLIGFNDHIIIQWLNILDCNALFNLYSPTLCLCCQPIVKFIAADNAQRMSFAYADIQSPCFKIKMDTICIHMRNLAYVEAESLENDLRINDESACAKLETWIICFFQDQDAGREIREVFCKMQRSGESTWPPPIIMTSRFSVSCSCI